MYVRLLIRKSISEIRLVKNAEWELMLSSSTRKPSKYCQPEVFSTRCFISSPMGAIIYNKIKNILNLGSGWHCSRWVSKHFLDNPIKSLRLGLLHVVNNMKFKKKKKKR